MFCTFTSNFSGSLLWLRSFFIIISQAHLFRFYVLLLRFCILLLLRARFVGDLVLMFPLCYNILFTYNLCVFCLVFLFFFLYKNRIQFAVSFRCSLLYSCCCSWYTHVLLLLQHSFCWLLLGSCHKSMARPLVFLAVFHVLLVYFFLLCYFRIICALFITAASTYYVTRVKQTKFVLVLCL